jgi:hypothetical protein
MGRDGLDADMHERISQDEPGKRWVLGQHENGVAFGVAFSLPHRPIRCYSVPFLLQARSRQMAQKT